MTSRERLLAALCRQVPDRLPVTVHQWQQYHLDRYLDGISALAAFRRFGMDATISVFAYDFAESHDWRTGIRTHVDADGYRVTHTTIATPGGTLSTTSAANDMTSWVTEPMVKRPEDIELLRRYLPVPGIDLEAVGAAKRELGEDGILRGFPFGYQGSPWQDACCYHGTEEMIYAAIDRPDWTREFLNVLLEKKLEFVERWLVRCPFDVIETGGGAGSSTVISPQIFEEFLLPVDRKLHEALHAAGHQAVYHTCGGMMPILELIVRNGCDVSETLSPREVGGDADHAEIKRRIGKKVSLIGGMNQFQVLTEGTPESIRAEVRRLFAALGPGGGYVLSPSDHFFDAPAENLQAYADAARECMY